MTAIACKVEKGSIHLAADTQTTWGSYKYPSKESSEQVQVNGKIFSTNDMHIACAGDVSTSGFLQLFARNHKPIGSNKNDVLDWFVEFRDWCKQKYSHDVDVSLIIVFNSKAFVVHDFLECYLVEDHAAIGSGQVCCVVAFECGATAIEAVSCAIKYNLYCGGEAKEVVIQCDN